MWLFIRIEKNINEAIMRDPCPLILMTNMQPGSPYMPIHVKNAKKLPKCQSKTPKSVSSQCNKIKIKKKRASQTEKSFGIKPTTELVN